RAGVTTSTLPGSPRRLAPEVVLADARLEDVWSSAEVVAVTIARPVDSSAPVPGALALAVAERLGVDLPAVLAAEKISGRAGDVPRLPVPPADGLPARVLLAGTGA